MVHFVAPVLGAILFSGLTGAAPAWKRDSALGTEVAVSAPDGTPISDTQELSSQLQSETTSFAGDATTTVDPAALPTDSSDSGVLSGGAVGTDGESSSVAATSVAPPPAVISSGSGSSYNLPQYGSGYSSWMNNYNDCVTQCMVQYPPPPTTITMPPSSSSVSSGSDDSSDSSDLSSSDNSTASSSGSAYNVIVAPQQGVLRFVPPYMQAQPGDVITFNWHAGPHTVTQSSELTPCNASIGGFASGQQNVGASFQITVNDTNPIFFYCGVPGHCQKGMFGAINPPQGDAGSNSTVGSMMSVWAGADPDIAQALNVTNALAANATGAAQTAGMTWGNELDVSKIDPSLHASLAKSVLYARQVMSSNPASFDSTGKFNPIGNVTVPFDLSAALDNADAGGPNAANAANAAAGPTNSSSSSSPAPTGKTGAALSVRSSGVAVAAVAVLAAFFAL